VIGVFGGSGFYEFLDEVEELRIETPFGAPSAAIRVGQIEGSKVAFMPRHGDKHEYPPHKVNFRANVWAMREAGVRRIIGPCACGSLQPDLHPGTFVVADQFVDRTSGRADTFYDDRTVYGSAADPYCPELRGILAEEAEALGIEVRKAGTVVVIQGPRFSTRAESRWFGSMGWTVVNMTQYPEAWLARELELCYATVALVTDYDVGLEGMPHLEPVSAEGAFRVFAENLSRLRDLLFRAIPRIGPQPEDVCARALTSAIVH
jgi:5'-methylthioadenosine phosphorylase